MNPLLVGIVGLLKAGNYLLNKGVADLDMEQYYEQIGERSNPIVWIAGHMTNSRYNALKMLRVEAEFSWQETFKRGSRYHPDRDYPTVEELLEAWQSGSEVLIEKVSQLEEAELSRKLPAKFPHGDNTVMGMLSFIVFHESHHMGQISYIRRCIGLEGLVK